MPSKSSGRIEKARKNKGGTPHKKNHRWESFSTKISKFNSLQPLRKVRRHDLETEDLTAATSYFHNGLQRWNELNIARGFASFKREVLSISESLPQILHFEERIMASLASHIAEQDRESLEPLLDLLTAFAHDLGIRFEKHYQQSLELLLAIAGKPQDADVIEWTFGAMAFLFKYLSKLLVPDLRPTYDVMAPLLGKSRHPSYIARFAAEAMSFLVKKAGAPSQRETSLPLFVNHVAQDLRSIASDRQFVLYKDGIMTMFAEALKGTDYTIHSTGAAIFAAVVDAIPSEEMKLAEEDTWTDVACGILTSIMHHSTAETFKDFADSVMDKIEGKLEEVPPTQSEWRLIPYIRLLGVLGGVRRGGRITDWPRLVGLAVKLLEKTAKTAQGSPQDVSNLLWSRVIVKVAIVWHHAPVDALIPFMGRLVHVLSREPFMKLFIPFCAYFCELDSRRFGSLFRTDFQRFVASHWSQGANEDMLCILLPKMIENRGFPPAGEKDSFRLPQGWQDQIVLKFERLEITPFPERGPYDKDPEVWRGRCLPKYSALLRILELAAVHPSTNARIAELLLRKLKLALRPSSTLASEEVHFIVGQGFHAYLRMSKAAGSVDKSLSPLLRAAVPRFARSVGFLHAYLAYEHILQAENPEPRDGSSSDSSSSEEDPVINSLIENLTSPSHDIRMASLEILKLLDETEDSTQLIDTMLQLEQTPLALDQTRTIAMFLRKLGGRYASIDSTSWLKHGVPSFMFGMLTVKLSPVWDDAIEAMKQVAETKEGEEIVSTIAFKWLDVPSARWTPPNPQGYGANNYFKSDFECTVFNGLQKTAASVETAMENADDHMRQLFDDKQGTGDATIQNARTRALKVFNALPLAAEKRSRRLVPYFLCWAGNEQEDADDEQSQQAATWSLTDRKALIGVLSQVINPKVLYQHEQVYEALLQLMENGDVEVQKSALKAILAWKQEGVKPYQENLEYLLDEARFKNELTVFLQGENIIRAEHRSQLMPVLLRLLYGRTIAKKGAASGRHGLQATRLAVLRNLSVEDLGSFLDIATGKLSGMRVVGTTVNRDQLLSKPLIPARKQVGFLNMISSLISELGTNVTPYMDTLVNSILYCLGYACRHLRDTSAHDDDESPEDDEEASSHSLLKASRSTGLKCLNALFQNAQDYQWSPYHDFIIEEVIAPRLPNFTVENTQGVSGLLQLLATWAALPKAALFLAPHGEVLSQGVLPHIIPSLSLEKTKDDVKVCILKLVCNLIRLASAPATESEYNEIIKADLIDPVAGDTVAHIAKVLKTPGISTDLLDTSVETILAFATVLQDSNDVQEIIPISTYLLQQPPRRVNPRTKGRVLLVVERFLSLPSSTRNQDLVDDVYKTLSSLFSYFKDRENRESLSRALTVIAREEAALQPVAALCVELNSFKEGRIEEPDYDRRLVAFSKISGDLTLSPRQWLPLLHNLIFYIKMDEEFGLLSSNAAGGIQRFIRNVVACQDEEQRTAFESQLTNVVMPAIHSGAREMSETVRREILRVLGFLLSSMPTWGPMADMDTLLEGCQDDSSEPPFFFNILSPAVARQLEALRILEAANSTKEMGSQILGQFFIPLLEHFIFDRVDGSDDHGLGAQAANTIGALATSLNWKHYRTTMQRYISYVGNKPEAQKQTIRLLGRFVDSLVDGLPDKDSDSMDLDEPKDITASSDSNAKRLAATTPKGAELHTEIVDHFLPSLIKYLHEKDEAEVSYRVPIGVVVVKLLKALPTDELDQKLAGVLTDISYILRSKSTESRDLTRDTLVKIAAVLGPGYFGFLLKELRSALTKGYQLHVLSYTMHSILVQTVNSFAPGDLDYCLPAIVSVIMDDIFGVVGQEKDAEGYISQMKEVKGSKSQDSMELIAKTASVSRLISLVKPIQALLMQKVDLKMVRKIDALMARITAGLLQNAAAGTRETLVFCYEVVQVVYDSQKPEVEVKMDPRVRKYLVQRGAKRSGERGMTTKHTHKLTRFAMDVLRAMFKKHDSLRTPEHAAGFLPIIGDAILDGEDEVKIAAFRLLAVLVKVPFPDNEGTNMYKIAVKEAIKTISMSTSTTTEISQAALKMLAVVLRDCRDVPIKDAPLDMLLGKLKDDLTQPLYRHVTFNFLRAVLDRRIETATVYDTMDYVGTVMITNDDKDTRDLARGAFFQFVREYPQKKARWAKQLDFIVANLKYDREGGRLSVMEVLHLLLMKSSDEFVQEVAATCFLPLFFVLANDDSDKCRQAASELLKEVFRKSDKERAQKFLTLLRSWVDNDGNATVQRLGFQVFGHYFESYPEASKNKKDFTLVLNKAAGIVAADDVNEVDAELLETVLSAVQILTTVLPEKVLAGQNEGLWKNISKCMAHGHHGAQLAAVRLIAMYLADFAKQGLGASAQEAIDGSYGLSLSLDDAQNLIRQTLKILYGREVDETLANEAGQVLIFLAHRLPAPATPDEAEGEDEEDADEDEEDETTKTLGYLFQRLSHVLRKEIAPKSAAITSKVVAMEVLETVCRRSSTERLAPSLKTILVPLHNITDPTIAAPYSADELFKTKHEALKTRAQILMDALQKKFGTVEYSKQLLAIREAVKAKREQRSSKRKIEALAHPEKYGRDKRKKLEKEKERRKTRSKEQKTMRQAYKGW